MTVKLQCAVTMNAQIHQFLKLNIILSYLPPSESFSFKVISIWRTSFRFSIVSLRSAVSLVMSSTIISCTFCGENLKVCNLRDLCAVKVRWLKVNKRTIFKFNPCFELYKESNLVKGYFQLIWLTSFVFICRCEE